jgi:hypothetical protein
LAHAALMQALVQVRLALLAMVVVQDQEWMVVW